MLEKLTKQFGGKGLSFSMQGNLVLLEVENSHAKAKITTHGGCLLSYIPKVGSSANNDILWVSDQSIYDGSKPIRGGVPICWPWFGAADEQGLPAHGFVRNKAWQVESVSNLANDVTQVVMTLESDAETLAIWPFAFHLSLTIEISEQLLMTLTMQNLNDVDLPISEAFHSYFSVEDVNSVLVKGLKGSIKLDKLTNAKSVKPLVDYQVVTPMDDVYLNQSKSIEFVDTGNKRTIVLDKMNASSTIVWNPGSEGVSNFSDINKQDWTKFICIEAGNVLDNTTTVASGDKHSFAMKISVENV